MPLTVPLIRMSPGCEYVCAACGLVKMSSRHRLGARNICSRLAILNAKAVDVWLISYLEEEHRVVVGSPHPACLAL